MLGIYEMQDLLEHQIKLLREFSRKADNPAEAAILSDSLVNLVELNIKLIQQGKK